MGTRERLSTGKLHPQAQELHDFLSNRLISQKRAINAVVTAYNRSLSKLWESKKPIIAMLNTGPSGSGKTYIAELLAEFFFDDPKGLTKVACGEYAERHEISKLIGSPPGYLGYKDTPRLAQENLNAAAKRYHRKTDGRVLRLDKEIGRLVASREKSNEIDSIVIDQQINQRVSKRESLLANALDYGSYPTCVLLFDEFEKANQTIMHFLLEVTERGTITLADGSEVDLTRAFIIMTSNVASTQIAKAAKGIGSIGFQTEQATSDNDKSVYAAAVAAAKKSFSTEFLNRVLMIVYRVLSVTELAKIRDRQIMNIEERLIKNDSQIKIFVSRKVRDFILAEAVDHPEFGAREIVRKVAKYIQDNLEKAMVSNDIGLDDSVRISFELEYPAGKPTIVLYRENPDTTAQATEE